MALSCFRRGYVRVLTMLLKRRLIIPAVAALMLTLGGVMAMLVGRDFFPDIDGGQIKLHVRAPAATRIEATERIFQEVEEKIREVIPARDLDLVVDDIGDATAAVQPCFYRRLDHQRQRRHDPLSLKEGHAPTAGYVRRLRECCRPHFRPRPSISRPPT